jgi:hypothetical protein
LNSHFEDNIGTMSGGALAYDFYQPHLEGNVFNNNRAFYGENIAGYPVGLRLIESMHII